MKLAVFLFCKSQEVFSLTLSFASAFSFILHPPVTKLFREFQPNQPDAPNSHNIMWSPHVEPWTMCSVPIKPNWTWSTKQLINKRQTEEGREGIFGTWVMTSHIHYFSHFCFYYWHPNVGLITWVFMQYLILWTCMIKTKFAAYS